MNHFTLIKKSGTARAGDLSTAHGIIPTPVFLPVGSQATVKTLTPHDLHEIGSKIILSNTYHLYLRPGIDIVKEMGGLHKFMQWPGAILTDSGGYQVFSLAGLRKLTDDGVQFRSHIDGSSHFLTPELALSYQESLGSDIMMVLDECPGHDDTAEKVTGAMERTHRWAERSRAAYDNNSQALYGIVQGGLNPDLRAKSVQYLTALDFTGYAIGGLSLGEPKPVMYDIVSHTAGLLPADKPRYLMGVGSPEDIIAGVSRGIDIFDCALPTRVARNGALFTAKGRINIRNSTYSRQARPVDAVCRCYACRNFSAAYIHHLFNAGEILGLRLATLHNLTFMQELINSIRHAIIEDRYHLFAAKFLEDYKITNEETRLEQKQKWLKARKTHEEE